MSQHRFRHDLAYRESFDIRRPVLNTMPSLKGQWHVSQDGKQLETERSLEAYSPHERAIIEFAINPLVMAENIFGGLDQSARRELAKAIHSFFGQGGPGDK